MRPFVLTAILILTGGAIVGGGAVAADPTPAKAIVAHARDATPDSRIEAGQAVDDSVAAALIGAIAEQFDEQRVDVKLDVVEMTPADLVQRDVRGRGRLTIGDDPQWIPFEFAALYDTTNASVGYPALTLGTEAPGTALADDAHMRERLEREVDRRMGAEFAQQAVRVDLDQVQVLPAGGHFLHLTGNGIARFEGEGTASAGIDALYDPRNGQWLRVNYELGAAATRAGDDVALDADGYDTLALR